MSDKRIEQMVNVGAALVALWIIGVVVLVGVGREVPEFLRLAGASIVTGWLGLMVQKAN